VSTVDWSDGAVRDIVMKVMAGLMDAPVRKPSDRRVREKGHDPSVTMEMRHKQVSGQLDRY